MYHGCGVYHRDGSNVLITKRRSCSIPVNACFWMQGNHVNKKVRTRKREYDATVYHSKNLQKQYESELARQKPNITFYSTDDETMSDTDTDTDSNVSNVELAYDSDDNRLVIDIENMKKSISQISKRITNRLATADTLNLLNQLPAIKTDTNQTPDVADQTPGSQNEASQTQNNK